MVRDVYGWDDDSYDAVRAAGVDWRSAMFVLYHTHPKVRKHVGPLLSIAGRDQTGRWLAVTLAEKSDDSYHVVDAHWLDADEQEAVEKMNQGGKP